MRTGQERFATKGTNGAECLSSESFDGVTAPTLPAMWTSTVAVGGAEDGWRTQTGSSDTAPNAVFVPSRDGATDIRLDSPALAIATDARVTFRHRYDLEAQPDASSAWDAGVLEISIDGAAFADIFAAGGSFVSGGYTSNISFLTTRSA